MPNYKPTGTRKADIKKGTFVAIIGAYYITLLTPEKENQQSGTESFGVVQDILTHSLLHHRGIKVRLTNNVVGRVLATINGRLAAYYRRKNSTLYEILKWKKPF